MSDTGKCQEVAISPDGKYLLSMYEDKGKQSLWLLHVPTNSNTQIVAPEDASYQDLIFSPDGNYIYFRKSTNRAETGYDLFRAPVLGGTPQLVLHQVNSGISFSPDGKRIAFMRANDPDIGKFHMFTANADGTDAKMLYGGVTSSLAAVVAWSPDGTRIASLLQYARGAISVIEMADVATAKTDTAVQTKDRELDELKWVPDGSGLLTTSQAGASPPPLHLQIGFVPIPGGEYRPITRDTNAYRTLSLSADGKMMAAIQQRATQTFYVLPAEGFAGSSTTPAAAQNKESHFFDWAGNDGVYFDGDLIRISLDGISRKTIVSDPAQHIFKPGACQPAGIVNFVWQGHPESSKTNIWRVDADGTNLKQLTIGVGDVGPVCSTDGRCVYYRELLKNRIMRVPAAGGDADVVPGTDLPVMLPAAPGIDISREGRFLIFSTMKKREIGSLKLAIVDLSAGAGQQARLVDPDRRIVGFAHFSPDGKSIVYVIRESGVDDLWLQPLDGSRGRALTNFASDKIQNFEYSPDGKTLGMMRSHIESDIVVLRDTSGTPR